MPHAVPGTEVSFQVDTAGSKRRGVPAAIACTLVETARLIGVGPQGWLTVVPGRIAEHKITLLDELTPWRAQTWARRETLDLQQSDLTGRPTRTPGSLKFFALSKANCIPDNSVFTHRPQCSSRGWERGMSTYFSEIYYGGDGSQDFMEVRVPAGTDTSGWTVVVYQADGSEVGTISFGTAVSTNAGGDVYLFDDQDTNFNDIVSDYALAIVDDTSTVLQFISMSGNTVTATNGPANGDTSTDVGTASSGSSLESTDGVTYYDQPAENPGTVPCYAPGTLIDTPDGPRAVELLRAGDLVSTRDHGPMPILWVRCVAHPFEDTDDEAKPVQIKAGALGRNLPVRDLIVSPQHRILVGGAGQLDAVFTSEAFAPAKSLTAVPGIRHMKGKAQITWISFACDRHEVVRTNGCLSESLLLGPMVVNGLTATERRTLTDLFGPAATPGAALNGPPARECLKVGAVKRQLARHLKAKGRLVAREIREWDRDLAMEKYESERMRAARSLPRSSETARRVA